MAPTGLDGERTDRYRGVLAVAALVATVGALASVPALVVAAVVVAALPALGHARSPPTPALAVERTLDPVDPAPGARVDVALTVENVGDARLADCRVVDALPDALAVERGSHSLAVALATGESATTTYAAQVPSGEHAFGDPFVAVRDATGAVASSGRVDAIGASELAASRPLPDANPASFAPPGRGRPGRVPSDDAGDGLAFEAVREYRRGDPVARVDWRRFARTGDLATVAYRETHAPTLVVVVDARDAAHLASDPGDESAIRRCANAARHLAGGDDLSRVGVVALAPDYPTLAPGTGRAHDHRLGRFLEALPGVSDAPAPLAADGATLAAAIRSRAPTGAHLCLCSPACDDAPVDAAIRLAAAGYRVGVCSPDPTAPVDAGGQLAALERRARLRDLRRRGVAVADWRDGPLATALANAGWST